MLKFVFLGVVILGIVLTFFYFINTEAQQAEVVGNPKATDIPAQTYEADPVTTVSKSIFVPYWSVSNMSGIEEYDTAIYFGVSPTENGLNKQDQGFVNIETFVQKTAGVNTYLTLRMLDTDSNLKILDSTSSQDKIISELLTTANSYGFDGIVLDLELSVIPFSDVTQSVNLFVQKLGEEVKGENMHFAVAMYGDTYYRSRPYDISVIGKSADEILIMAYDFHKSRGEPGPNFPLDGRKTYGYDFKQMITDFTHDVEPEKISVIFGMYGYDWTLGSEGMPLTGAKSLSLSDMQKEFIESCEYNSCNVKRDSESSEMNVSYVDEENYEHSVWFEDEESVDKKVQYLMEQGIGNISYWTWGYW